MRRHKTSRLEEQSWKFLFSVIVSISVLSLLILILMGAGLTGFVVTNPQPPSNVSVSLDSSSYPERTVITGDVFIQLDGPLEQTTQYYTSIGGNQTSLSLLEALDRQNIPYLLTEPTPQVETVASSTTLVYSGRGEQTFLFRLPKTIQVQQLAMNVHGRSEGGSFPSFPKIDANRDGQYEWEYVGNFIDFNSTFTLPEGLREQQENRVSVNEQNVYYCELITLPRSKDFLVSAKYQSLLPESGADLEIILFSATGSGQSWTGTGGTNACDLDESYTSAPEYRTCALSLSYVAQGNYFVCMHNAGLNLAPDTYYEFSRDLDSNSGYRCGAISNGRTTCTSQQGDYFIKVQPASYDGVLDRQVQLAEGAPTPLLPAKLNEQLQTCTAYGDFCYILLEMVSETQGSLYLDSLDITYSDQGSIVHERNFYTLSSNSPILYSIAGRDLTQENYTLVLPLELLDLAAPVLSSQQQTRNYTLEVGLTPGPSVQTLLTVFRTNATVNTTLTGNFTDDVTFYKQLFTSMLQDHEEILTLGNYKTKLENVLESLSSYVTLSRGSQNDSNTSLLQLEDDIMDAIAFLPQYIASLGSASFTPSVSSSDFTDDLVYAQQRDENTKLQLAYLQQQYAPAVNAESLEVVLFNGQKQTFTVIEHSTFASISAGKMATIFPSALATSLNGVSFTENPRTTASTSPLTVRWDLGSLPSTMKYVVKGNLLSSVDDLRVLFIPEQIPQQTEQPRTTCGDKVCSVLVSGGQKIYLEDSDSCPVDCGGTGGSWTWIIALLLFVVLAYYYFGGMYTGPGNFKEVLQRMKKSNKPSNKLFTSASDESNLKTYVQNALKKGVSQKELSETLLNRGWTKPQVDSIMKQAKP
ncbi:MAG TPA: hypothetical protein VJH37_01820 [Candidatus Nanoarchaeia archaeon]|nr:hypothetical protein [Candidatus Nanoarchaeia archaeon]